MEPHINVAEGIKELVIRNGSATLPVELRGLVIDGNIFAPKVFLKNRTVVKEECVVIVDDNTGTIELFTDEHTIEKNGHKVKGSLKINPELESWGINKEKYYDVRDLIKQVRYNKNHFTSSVECQSLLDRLATFSVKVEQQATDTSAKNKSGKTTDKNITHILPDSFSLSLAIYSGDEKQKFSVEPLVDMDGDEPRIWIESVELSELIKERRKELLSTVVSSDEFNGIAVIWK